MPKLGDLFPTLEGLLLLQSEDKAKLKNLRELQDKGLQYDRVEMSLLLGRIGERYRKIHAIEVDARAVIDTLYPQPEPERQYSNEPDYNAPF